MGNKNNLDLEHSANIIKSKIKKNKEDPIQFTGYSEILENAMQQLGIEIRFLKYGDQAVDCDILYNKGMEVGYFESFDLEKEIVHSVETIEDILSVHRTHELGNFTRTLIEVEDILSDSFNLYILVKNHKKG